MTGGASVIAGSPSPSILTRGSIHPLPMQRVTRTAVERCRLPWAGGIPEGANLGETKFSKMPTKQDAHSIPLHLAWCGKN